MTTVFVHGVPEAADIWNPLISELGRDDAVVLSPPGFGAPVPDGFGATAPEYADWLAAELDRIGEPVDLVGHDWGGGHAIGAAIRRPDLVRRLVTDIAGTADPDYEWHDMAQLWQTPGQGEAILEAMNAMQFDDRVQGFVDMGMTPGGARACVEAGGADMSACIVSLYRSAVQPNMTNWGAEYEQLDDRPDTLVIAAADDHYTGGEAMARRTAERWGAKIAVLDGLGHWWMMQDPARGAEALADFLD